MEIIPTNSPETAAGNTAVLSDISNLMQSIGDAVRTVVVGQHDAVELLLAGLLADGHLLLEGAPGVAKTLLAKLLARLVDARFARIQFTPDLLPSDVLGTSIFNPQSAEFQFKAGPVFGNIVLIDEVNRAPAKTQAALFEVMEERQVTIDGITHAMEPPFMVVATQNPIEHEGTYRLPEAQLDRFLMKIVIPHPNLEEETQILLRHSGEPSSEALKRIRPIVSKTMLAAARAAVRKVTVEQKVLQFIARIVWETRQDRSIYLGGSPRASLALLQVSKALAVMRGRDFVIPEDVVETVPPVLRHRITLTPEKEMEGNAVDEVLKDIVARIEVPR